MVNFNIVKPHISGELRKLQTVRCSAKKPEVRDIREIPLEPQIISVTITEKSSVLPPSPPSDVQIQEWFPFIPRQKSELPN